eukprot:UN4125
MKRKYILEEVGIILDYTSFYQEPRTDDQQKSFKECLNLINVPYGHKDVTAVKFVTVPTEENRTYDDRGWTKFESDVIDSKPAAESFGWLNVLTCSSSANTDLDAMSECQRRPPVIPSRFKAEMEDRRAPEGRLNGPAVCCMLAASVGRATAPRIAGGIPQL